MNEDLWAHSCFGCTVQKQRNSAYCTRRSPQIDRKAAKPEIQ